MRIIFCYFTLPVLIDKRVHSKNFINFTLNMYDHSVYWTSQIMLTAWLYVSLSGIRILQSILLKLCLVLGVKIHFPVKFVDLVEPKSSGGNWSVAVDPSTSPLSSKHYDAILSADGKKYSLPGFQSKEFRARLAIAITANFTNQNTDEEVAVEEISGVSYIYNQSFFNTLSAKHGIDLENIVYYKDETHYFVMTAKKTSLLSKGVLKKVSRKLSFPFARKSAFRHLFVLWLLTK